MTLPDELFLLAHDNSGRLIATESGIGIGIAGATLAGLILDRRLALATGRISVVDDTLTGDPVSDAALTALTSGQVPPDPRALVARLADGAYQRAADALVASVTVERRIESRVGLRSVARYRPVDESAVVRARAKLRYAVHDPRAPEAGTAVLCALVRLVRVEAMLYLDLPTGDLLARLDNIAALQEATMRQVTSAVEAVLAANSVVHRLATATAGLIKRR